MSAVRWTVLVLTAVVLQSAVLPAVRPLGVVPELGLVVAVAVAYHRGPEAGAVVGFCAGLGVDLSLETPLGLSALAWTATAYAVGVFQTGLLRSTRVAAPMIGGLAGLAGGLLFVGLGVVVGATGVQGWGTIWVVARAAVCAVVLAVAVFPLVRVVVPPPPGEPRARAWSRP